MPDPAPVSAHKLAPLILEATPRDPDAISSFYLWLRVMTEVLDRIPAHESDTFRFTTLSRGLANRNYMTIKDAPDVATALQILKTQFLPKTNVVISRNRHMSRTQREGEDLATYLSEINLLGAEFKYEDILEVRDYLNPIGMFL